MSTCPNCGDYTYTEVIEVIDIDDDLHFNIWVCFICGEEWHGGIQSREVEPVNASND